MPISLPKLSLCPWPLNMKHTHTIFPMKNQWYLHLYLMPTDLTESQDTQGPRLNSSFSADEPET